MRNMLRYAVFGTAFIALCGPSAAQNVNVDRGKLLEKSVLSGNESRIAAFNLVAPDCSSDRQIVHRLVTKPATGSVRVENVKIAVSKPKDSPYAHCNGKEANAVGVFYTAPEGFVGVDKVVVDIDWRNGNVERYTYTIKVR